MTPSPAMNPAWLTRVAMTPLQSSNLRGVGIWAGLLVIEFQSGAMYVYFDVPSELYDGLLSADSPGRYHARHIRNAYPYTRVA